MVCFRPLPVLTLWFLLGFAALNGLGLWQLARLEEKQALIARVAAALSAEPVALGEALREGLAGAEWRRVKVTGRFLHDKELYVFSRGPGGAVGVDVVTPLVQDDGEAVLINRGFVPERLRDPETRKAGQVEGTVALSGVLRLSQKPGMFTPAPNRDARLWFVRDAAAMAEAAGLAAPPFLIEADATPNPGGWPQGGRAEVDFPNNHLQYALTWFGLALALAAVYLLYHRSRGRIQWR